MAPQYAPPPVQQRATMPTQMIDFTSYIENVRKIYRKYSSSSGSKEYDNASDATDEIQDILKSIKRQARNVTFGDKQDAISTIIDIAHEVLDGGSTLGSEIRKTSSMLDVSGAIEGILDYLTAEETAILQADGALAEDLQRLSAGADDYALDLDLTGAIERLSAESDDEEDEEDEEDEDDEDNEGDHEDQATH